MKTPIPSSQSQTDRCIHSLSLLFYILSTLGLDGVFVCLPAQPEAVNTMRAGTILPLSQIPRLSSEPDRELPIGGCFLEEGEACSSVRVQPEEGLSGGQGSSRGQEEVRQALEHRER